MKHMIKHTLFPVLCASLGLMAQLASAQSAGTPDSTNGEQIYTHICQGCHMPDGQGAVGAGYYPTFAGNPNIASAQYMALTVLFGRRNMPSFVEGGASGNELWFSVALNDEQVANVVNYIRSHFGNTYTDTLTAADVKALHELR
jgi:mono/diheme cytochrome c family protein